MKYQVYNPNKILSRVMLTDPATGGITFKDFPPKSVTVIDESEFSCALENLVDREELTIEPIHEAE